MPPYQSVNLAFNNKNNFHHSTWRYYISPPLTPWRMRCWEGGSAGAMETCSGSLSLHWDFLTWEFYFLETTFLYWYTWDLLPLSIFSIKQPWRATAVSDESKECSWNFRLLLKPPTDTSLQSGGRIKLLKNLFFCNLYIFEVKWICCMKQWSTWSGCGSVSSTHNEGAFTEGVLGSL